MHLVSWTATPIRDGYSNPRHFGNVNDDLTIFIQRRRLNICARARVMVHRSTEHRALWTSSPDPRSYFERYVDT
jgi:hypothetical protein